MASLTQSLSLCCIILVLCSPTIDTEDDKNLQANNVSVSAPFVPKQKFGLAWLFSFNKKNKKTPPALEVEEEEEKIDKRALDTNIYMIASYGKMRVLSQKSYCPGDMKKENLLCDFEDSLEQVEAREGEDVSLTCKLQNVHYQIDLSKLKMEWNWIQKMGCNESTALLFLGDKIVQVKPQCIIMTDFPFTDLQTSSKNISCTADIVLSEVTVNNTGKYRCSAVFGFSDSPVLYEHLYGEVFLRVSRRNDYHIHKIVSSLIVASILLVSFFLLLKKLLKFKMSWEGKSENYAAEWPGTVPARRIASSGSLGGRRLSGPIIIEEEEEEDEEEEGGSCEGSLELEEAEVVFSEDVPIKSSLKRPKLDSVGGLEFNFE